MSPTRSQRSRLWPALLGLLGLLIGMLAIPAPAMAAPDFTAAGVEPDSIEGTNRSKTGSLARSDPGLLARDDAERISVMVKLDVDPIASYGGELDGYEATSPEVTGRPLSMSDPAVAAYAEYLDGVTTQAADDILAMVPAASLVSTLTVVYGGLAVSIPANRASDLLQLDIVAAVQFNRELDVATGTSSPSPTDDTTVEPGPGTTVIPEPTSSPSATATPSPTPTPSPTATATPTPTPSPTSTTGPGVTTGGVEVPPLPDPAGDMDASTFIGADPVWDRLGGRDTAGEGLIVGVLDTGIWPEHPMLADTGIDAPEGTWECEFGDGSLGDAFACNDKLIGAYAFLDAQLAQGRGSAEQFCNGSECSARDSDGHGTHTATTAAGNYVEEAPILGIDRGPASGIAPGASVIAYRVCLEGCIQSDSMAAVGQAILDGVDVINFSISGGTNAYTDPVELTFLDAYAAGVAVTASAGNEGPGAGTANHAGPWTTTVGASTFDRQYASTLVLASSDGASFTQQGTTLTEGVTDLPVVLPDDVPGYTGTALCLEPFPEDSVTGMVVLCVRGEIARVSKGYNAAAGGAAGMILLNPELLDLQTDTHFLPAIQLEGPAEGIDAATDDVLDFVSSHPDVVATWEPGQAVQAQGDVMAGFSSRGPLGDFLKPDITAPGVQVLAGQTPDPEDESISVPGQLYQSIAGTSMSAPHAAGVSLLIKAINPSWGPGQIKSALMTSSLTDVVNAGGDTAGGFDRGAGSIRADRAVNVPLTISETATGFAESAIDEDGRVDLNIASVYVDPLPGAIKTSRTVTNVTGRTQYFRVSATGENGMRVRVSPSSFSIAPGDSRDLSIVIDALEAGEGWHEGRITIDPVRWGLDNVEIPVMANVAEAEVTFAQSCDPTSIRWLRATTCTVAASNFLPVEVEASIEVTPSPLLYLSNVTSPARRTWTGASWSGTLAQAEPPTIEAVNPVDPGDHPRWGLPAAGAVRGLRHARAG